MNTVILSAESMATIREYIWRHPNPSSKLFSKLLTLYFPMFPFDPPEKIRKPKVFRCFQGDQKGTLGSKGLSHIWSH